MAVVSPEQVRVADRASGSGLVERDRGPANRGGRGRHPAAPAPGATGRLHQLASRRRHRAVTGTDRQVVTTCSGQPADRTVEMGRCPVRTAGPEGHELVIHDMKKKDNLPIATRTLLRQLEDPHVQAAAEEIAGGALQPFTNPPAPGPVYGAPTPEFGQTVKSA